MLHLLYLPLRLSVEPEPEVTSNSSPEVPQYMPACDRLSCLGEHVVPVFHLSLAALRTEYDLPDELVAPEPVLVHDADGQRRLANALVRKPEHEQFVVRGVQGSLEHRRLSLLRLLAVD